MQYKSQKFLNFLEIALISLKHTLFGLPSKLPIATRYWSIVTPIDDYLKMGYQETIKLTSYHYYYQIAVSEVSLSGGLAGKHIYEYKNGNP
jgi:hypothetical protein